MKARVLVPAFPVRSVSGAALGLLDPISFWGGVSPTDAKLTDARSRQYGATISDRVLLIRSLRGSSSGSSILLELVRAGIAPAAIVLAEPDAILALGVLVAHEMGWRSPPILQLSSEEQARIVDGCQVTIGEDGAVVVQL